MQGWQPTPGNQALKLGGQGDYVQTALSNLAGSELTIQFWFKGGSMQSAVRQQNGSLDDNEREWTGRTSETNRESLGKGWIVAGWNQFHILSHDGLLNGIYFDYRTATNGHWHHLTLTWRQNTKGGFASYIDGHLGARRDSRNVPIPNYLAPVCLGAYESGHEFTEGLLDEVAIWQRALSEEEIRDRWQVKLTGTEPGLIGLWSFDDATARDITGKSPSGKFMKNAHAVETEIPGLGAPMCWSRLDQPGAYRLTNLTTGVDYRLVAFMDLNGDGGWSRGEPRGEVAGGVKRITGDLAKAHIRLTVPVPFWRSWPFYSICTVTLVVLVGGTIRVVEKRRMRLEFGRLERQHELERERARIARDIHDDLGSSLTRIAWLSQMAEKDLAAPEKIEKHTRQIAQCARQSIQSLDEIVWAVNPGNDSLISLTQYVTHHVHECLGESTVKFRLEIPPDLPVLWLSSETRHGLFLAVKEALHNALKHAAATEVRVKFSVEGTVLTIQVEDNGRGFDPAAPSAGRRGHGLDNLKRRIEDLAGIFRCESAVKSGTRLAMTVALPAAPSTEAKPEAT